jgi:hypothetical protein
MPFDIDNLTKELGLRFRVPLSTTRIAGVHSTGWRESGQLLIYDKKSFSLR